MNRYGAEALRYWRTYLPDTYGKMVEDPETFFAELGEQADAEIEDRYLELRRAGCPGRERGGQAGPP